jgi:hypothetical protein
MPVAATSDAVSQSVNACTTGDWALSSLAQGRPHSEVPEVQVLFRVAPLRTRRAGFPSNGLSSDYSVIFAVCWPAWMSS